MKIVLFSALSIFAFDYVVALNASDLNVPKPVVVVVSEGEKIPVKLGELPEGIKRTLAGDAYKDWAVSEAFLVKDKVEYYLVTLKRGTEAKDVKFNKEGAIAE